MSVLSTPTGLSSATGVRLYLVRHGESVWNIESRLTGWSDIALSETGRAQADALAPLLADQRFHGVWSSPLERARETAERAWRRPFTVDERIKEFNFGVHEGKPLAEISDSYLALLRDFERFAPEGGELGLEFYRRVDAFFDDLVPGSHLIFTHGGVIKRALERTGIRRFVTNAGITVIDWSAKSLIDELKNPLIDRATLR